MFFHICSFIPGRIGRCLKTEPEIKGGTVFPAQEGPGNSVSVRPAHGKSAQLELQLHFFAGLEHAVGIRGGVQAFVAEAVYVTVVCIVIDQ